MGQKNRIGKELLRRGLISETQLEEALKSQAIFGGRLGSHLVDVGAIEEEQLARLLSARHRVPFVRSRHFNNLPREIIDQLPVELVEKHFAVPLKKDKRQMVVALPDPGDLDAIDAIGFHCGMRVKPVVAVESTLVRAMHRYYGLERVGQYILVPEDEPRQDPARAPDIDSEEEDESSWLGGPEQDAMLEDWELRQRQETTSPPPSARETTFTNQPVEASTVPPKPAATLEQLGEQFSRAANRDEIADLVIAWINREYRSGALLLVRGGVTFGWRAVRDRTPLPDFEQFQLGLDEPSILQMVADSHARYLGPVPRSPFNSLLLHELGGHIPEQVLIEPVLLLGRLIGFLYIDNPRLNLAAVAAEVRELAVKLAMAFEMLILQNKLAST